jgi:hypothetical protein
VRALERWDVLRRIARKEGRPKGRGAARQGPRHRPIDPPEGESEAKVAFQPRPADGSTSGGHARRGRRRLRCLESVEWRHIYGVGAGQRAGPGGGTTRFDLSAHKDATGHPDFGHVAATNEVANFDVYVDVDCVKVSGLTGDSTAVISGIVRRVTPVPNILGVGPGDRQTFDVEDGG